jgi:hypothetical protein
MILCTLTCQSHDSDLISSIVYWFASPQAHFLNNTSHTFPLRAFAPAIPLYGGLLPAPPRISPWFFPFTCYWYCHHSKASHLTSCTITLLVLFPALLLSTELILV